MTGRSPEGTDLRSTPQVEAVAEAIYDAMRDPIGGGEDKPWVPRGNSLMQDEARRRARAALGAAPQPSEGRVDLFATQLQETGRATVFPGDEDAALAALRAIGASSFTVSLRAAPVEPEPAKEPTND